MSLLVCSLYAEEYIPVMHCAQPNAIPADLKPAAMKLLRSLPTYGGLLMPVGGKRFPIAQAMALWGQGGNSYSLDLVRIGRSPRTGYVVVHRKTAIHRNM